MSDSQLPTVPRLLLGIAGVTLLAAGAVLAATELRIAWLAWPYWPALWAALGCVVVATFGGLLVLGAVRGRLRARLPGARTT